MYDNKLLKLVYVNLDLIWCKGQLMGEGMGDRPTKVAHINLIIQLVRYKINLP
jgi:hypothetical protein